MITIVCGTNRNHAVSRSITDIYYNILKAQGVDANIIDLGELPPDFIFSALYDKSGENESFNKYKAAMNDSSKYVFIVPEYNGSFPGVLKAFIDGMDYPTTFKNKIAALVGLSSGVLGADLALSHLSDILNYCGTTVLAIKPKLGQINQHMSDGVITNDNYNQILDEQIKQLIKIEL